MRATASYRATTWLRKSRARNDGRADVVRPLSPLRYYRRNGGKLALLVVPIVLGVVLIYTLHMVILSYYHVQYRAFIETRKYYTSIQARGELIGEDTLSTVQSHKDVAKVVPCVLGYTEMEGIISTVGVRIYMLYKADLPALIARMGLTLAEGRLPEPGKREIVLHEDVLKNKGLTIGNSIGNELVRDEKLLGQFEIVGTLRGTALAGFAPLETWEASVGVDRPEQYGVLLYPQEGKLEELNRYLDYLPVVGNEVSSFLNSTSELKRSSENIYFLLNTIYLSVLIILSTCLGFLTYLFYRGRLTEFAIMRVLGYSRQDIALRNGAEVIIITVLSALVGIAAAVGVGVALNAAVFGGMGTPLLLFDFRTLMVSLCVPALCIATQMLSIGLSLANMDVVRVIELESGGAL